MPEHNRYSVVFKCDDETLLSTQHFLEETKGALHDTARVYLMAVKKLRKAVDRGEVPENAFEIGNLVVISYPDGKTQSFTDEQMGALLDEYEKLNKYKATRNDRIIVTLEGGFTGGLMKSPVDVNLDMLGEKDFKRVSEIIDILQSRNAKLEKADCVGDFGYYVRIGDQKATSKDMKFVFFGGPFSQTPVVVVELEKILSGYAARPQSHPKTSQLKGPSGAE